MKTIKNIFRLGILGILLSLSSCEEDPISSRVTYYPVIDVAGDATVLVHEGEAYADPGAVGTIDGEEIPLDISFAGYYRGNVFNGTLDTNIADMYTQSYSATNADGFSSSATREIWVANTGDLVNSIEGLYTSTVFRNGTQGSPAANYTDIEYMLIWKNADGTYGISDAFGGWYLYGRAIAGSETPGGIIVANDIAANDFEFPATLSNSYFGGSAEITGMTVNAETGTIVFTTFWQADPATSYTFETHLTQVEF